MSIRISSEKIKEKYKNDTDLRSFIDKLRITEKENMFNKDRSLKGLTLYSKNFGDNGKIESLDVPYTYAINNGFVNEKEYTSSPYDFLYTLRNDQPYYIEQLKKDFEKSNTAIAGTSTGSGKTIIGTYFGSKFGLKTLCITKIKTVMISQIEAFEKSTTARVWNPLCEKLNLKMKDDFDVIVCLPGAIHHLAKIPGLLESIGFLILDEADTLCTESIIPGILSIQPKYILAQTATLERNDGFHQFINLVAGDKIVKSLEEISNYTVHLLKTEFEAEEERGKNGLIIGKVRNNASMIPERQDMIVDLVKKDLNRRYIIMFINAEGIENLKQKFIDNDILCDTLYGTKNKINKCQVLIGTYQKMGVGFDEANYMKEGFTCYADTLILTHTFKDIKWFKQSLGRIARCIQEGKHPNYVILIDKNPHCRRHINSFKKHITGRIIEENNSNTLRYRNSIKD